jgi:hypothetical protein
MASSGQPTIHTLWVGSELSPLEWLCLSSWVRLGYSVVLHTYNDLPVPKGVALFDAQNLIPKSKIFRNQRNGSLAVFADIYRVMILKRFDALWFDADIFLIRPFDFSPVNLLAREGGQDVSGINNAVMRLSSDHPILAEILSIYRNPLYGLPWSRPGKIWQIFVQSIASFGFGPQHLPWGALGYIPIQRYVSQHGFDGMLLDSNLCLSGHNSPLFEPVDDPDIAVANPVVYIHFWRSQRSDDLSNPKPLSIYWHLWKIMKIQPP